MRPVRHQSLPPLAEQVGSELCSGPGSGNSDRLGNGLPAACYSPYVRLPPFGGTQTADNGYDSANRPSGPKIPA